MFPTQVQMSLALLSPPRKNDKRREAFAQRARLARAVTAAQEVGGWLAQVVHLPSPTSLTHTHNHLLPTRDISI